MYFKLAGLACGAIDKLFVASRVQRSVVRSVAAAFGYVYACYGVTGSRTCCVAAHAEHVVAQRRQPCGQVERDGTVGRADPYERPVCKGKFCIAFGNGERFYVAAERLRTNVCHACGKSKCRQTAVVERTLAYYGKPAVFAEGYGNAVIVVIPVGKGIEAYLRQPFGEVDRSDAGFVNYRIIGCVYIIVVGGITECGIAEHKVGRIFVAGRKGESFKVFIACKCCCTYTFDCCGNFEGSYPAAVKRVCAYRFEL